MSPEIQSRMMLSGFACHFFQALIWRLNILTFSPAQDIVKKYFLDVTVVTLHLLSLTKDSIVIFALSLLTIALMRFAETTNFFFSFHFCHLFTEWCTYKSSGFIRESNLDDSCLLRTMHSLEISLSPFSSLLYVLGRNLTSSTIRAIYIHAVSFGSSTSLHSYWFYKHVSEVVPLISWVFGKKQTC